MDIRARSSRSAIALARSRRGPNAFALRAAHRRLRRLCSSVAIVRWWSNTRETALVADVRSFFASGVRQQKPAESRRAQGGGAEGDRTLDLRIAKARVVTLTSVL